MDDEDGSLCGTRIHVAVDFEDAVELEGLADFGDRIRKVLEQGMVDGVKVQRVLVTVGGKP